MKSLGLLAVSVFVLAAPAAWAGQVYVKGEMLEGQVESVSKDGLAFKTEYGEGDVTIAWADIERIESDREMVLAYGEEGEFASGRVLGVDGDVILFGHDEATAQRIPVDSIYGGFDQELWDDSTLTRLRARYRYWSAGLAFSGSFTQASTNSESLQIDTNVGHDKGPTRYLFDGLYHLSRSFDEVDDEKDTQSQRALMRIRGEHDVFARAYLFGSQSYEWDRVQKIKARLITRAGAGYRFIERDWGFVSGELAPSYIYQTTRDDCGACTTLPSGDQPTTSRRDGYWALSLGGRTEVALPYGSKFTASVGYFPDVVNWSAYLVEAKGVLSVPILDWVSFRLALDNTHNSDPADDARRNRFTSTIGLSVDF